MKHNAFKYWYYHKKQGFLIIFTVILSMVILMNTTFLVRSSMGTEYEKGLIEQGNYNFILTDISQEQLNKFVDSGLFADVGVMYRAYTLQTTSCEEYAAVTTDAKGLDLYHQTCKKGTYPTKDNEIAATEKMLLQIGLSPVVGSRGEFSVLEGENKVLKEYVVSGILEETQRDFVDIEFPEIFVYAPEKNSDIYCAIANEADVSSDCIYEFLEKEQYVYYDSLGKLFVEGNYITNADSYWQSNIEDKLSSAPKDFDSAILIPLFSIVIAVISFCSTVFALTLAFQARRENLCMYRLFGLTKRRSMIQIAVEILVFLQISVGIGYGTGILVYEAIYLVQSRLLHMQIVSGLSANSIIRAVTLNPYTFPLVIIFLSGIFAGLFVLCSINVPSPLEAVCKVKEWKKKRNGIRKQKLYSYMKRCLLSELGEQMVLFFVILFTMATVYFGILYVYDSYDTELENYRETLKEAKLQEFDYLAQKDFSKSTGIYGSVNRRFGAITGEDYNKLSDMEEVDFIKGVTEIKGSKIIADKTEKGFASESISENIQNDYEWIEDLYYKTFEHQGYQRDELSRMYNVATVAVPYGLLGSDDIQSYLLDGKINIEKLKSGEQIVLFLSDKQQNIPYQVGDRIHMTDVVTENTDVENFDFSSGDVPKNISPAFQYQYWDEETQDNQKAEAYVFGERIDYEAEVGAIVYCEEEVNDFYYTEALINESGFVILASREALDTWGLIDRNYTKVGVKVKDTCDITDFETKWYQILAGSQDMTSSSVKSIKDEIRRIRWEKAGIVILLCVSLIILGVVVIFNYIRMKMLHDTYTIQVYRMLGTQRKKIMFFWIRKMVGYIALAVCFAWFPLGLYEWRRKLMVNEFAVSVEGGNVFVLDGNAQGITGIRGGYSNLMNLPYIPIYVIAVFICSIVFISGIIITVHKNILESKQK